MKHAQSTVSLGYQYTKPQMNKTQGDLYHKPEKDVHALQKTFQICQKAPYQIKSKKHPEAKQTQ